MRVLLQSRAETFRRNGGEAQQILRLAAALERAGASIRVTAEIAPALDGVDLVHLFGIMQPAETLAQTRHAAQRGTPIVLTPIYQDLRDYHARAAGTRNLPAPAREWARLAAQTLSGDWPGTSAWRAQWQARGLEQESQRREIVAAAQGVLANSQLELDAVLKNYGPPAISSEKLLGVLRVGVGEEFFSASPEPFASRWGAQLDGALLRRELVVCAGFLSSLKNQLALLRALQGTGLQVVLAGAEVPTHRAYARDLRHEAQSGHPPALLTGPLSCGELASLFSAARVVAQPSWFETCGMAALEAAAVGANVVITECGFAREYFGDAAWYCRPEAPESIRRAVLDAWAAAPRTDLAGRIRAEFTWEAAALTARKFYEQVLARRTRRTP
ncbi:MAG TPA: glycosyltransferase [Candidatus Nitrosotenuis sp.]|nr:glycosyltransferase [Candidatus Nitrosotenuis sp.]